MASIADIRAKYPQYKDLSDQQLADALHAKFYSDMPVDQFYAKIGLPSASNGIRAGQSMTGGAADPQNMYDTAISRIQQHQGLSAEQVDRLKQQYDPSLFNLARAGTTFGLSDELSGLAGGLGNLAQPGGFGQGYSDYSQLQNATLDLAKQKNGMLGSAVELGTGLATMGPERAAIDAAMTGARTAAPSLLKTVATSAGTGAALGGIGGFTSTEGDIGQRTQGAEQGALGGAAVGAATPIIARGLSGLFSREAAKTAAPSIEDLKTQAGALYDAARNSGVTMNQKGTISLSDEMFQIARDEGLVSPTGRIASSYPRINDVLKTFDDFANGSMDVSQMQATRRTLQDAAKSADAGERRLGTIMLKKFDDVVDQGVPQLKDANALYHRAKKGELIDTAIELAGSRAGQFSGSGFENALRTEFRNLDRQIIKGQLKGITDEEAAAIKKVANGGPLENAARWLGKFAPTGVIPAIGAGGGMFAIGNAIGGPAAGGIAAGTALGSGALARKIATGMQSKNAAIASALMRRGGTAPVLSVGQKRIAQALLNSGLIGGPVAAQVGQQ